MHCWVERDKTQTPSSLFSDGLGNRYPNELLSKAVQRVESPCQVVDADHNDRVQNNDLTKEHDFFLGTFSAEEMPTVRGVYGVVNTTRGCHCHWVI